jgi:hypothetical protein
MHATDYRRVSTYRCCPAYSGAACSWVTRPQISLSINLSRDVEIVLDGDLF